VDGVLNVHKAAGPTSHDVVDEVRRLFGERRVGHAGTLDPMATGVLVVCLGRATRIVEYLVGAAKEYRARITFGRTTDTQDSTGKTVDERDASGLTRELFEEAASRFVGEIEQIPPMVSAVKHKGKPLYELARRGKSVERQARKVVIYSIEAHEFQPGTRALAHASAEMLVSCSSGTYIRTLCADIGELLGCGAHMSALERTKVGRFHIEDSVSVEDLKRFSADDRLGECVMGISEALSDLPSVLVTAHEASAVLHGLPVEIVDAPAVGTEARVIAPDGSMLALAVVQHRDGRSLIQPRKVLADQNR
jgi:tRNA pseudouridine55 synthase